MQLPRDGVEYAHWPINGVDDGTSVQVEINPGTWITTTITEGIVAVPVAGPDVASVPAGAVQILEAVRPRIKVTSNPETVIREGDWIRLTD